MFGRTAAPPTAWHSHSQPGRVAPAVSISTSVTAVQGRARQSHGVPAIPPPFRAESGSSAKTARSFRPKGPASDRCTAGRRRSASSARPGSWSARCWGERVFRNRSGRSSSRLLLTQEDEEPGAHDEAGAGEGERPGHFAEEDVAEEHAPEDERVLAGDDDGGRREAQRLVHAEVAAERA